MDAILGIDLGTTNSSVAILREGEVEVLREDGDPLLPSIVGLDGGVVLYVLLAFLAGFLLLGETGNPA